jgi:hypothetical protein
MFRVKGTNMAVHHVEISRDDAKVLLKNLKKLFGSETAWKSQNPRTWGRVELGATSQASRSPNGFHFRKSIKAIMRHIPAIARRSNYAPRCART